MGTVVPKDTFFQTSWGQDLHLQIGRSMPSDEDTCRSKTPTGRHAFYTATVNITHTHFYDLCKMQAESNDRIPNQTVRKEKKLCVARFFTFVVVNIQVVWC